MLASLLERFRPAAAAPNLPLAAALAELDIEPFKKEDVDRYKAEKHEAAFRAVLPKNYHGHYEIQWLEYKGTVAVSAADPARAIEVLRMKHEGWETRIFFNQQFYRMCHMVHVRWHRYPLNAAALTLAAVNHTIPEYVTRKAEQIAASVPGVVIEEDRLETKDVDLDPFLVVRLGDEEYYVEVWGAEEREFKREPAS